MPTTNALLWSGKSLFNFSSPPFPQSNVVGIVGLLWMIQHQYCVRGGGGGGVDRKTICWQKRNDQNCCYRITLTIPSWVSCVYTSYLYICVRGGEGKVDICWQKCNDQDCYYDNIDYTKLGCLCLHVIPIHFRIKRLQVMYVHICTVFAEKFTEEETGEW